MHLHDKSELKTWEKEWKGKISVSFGNTNSRGVAILLNPKKSIEIINNVHDSEGRIICSTLKIDNKVYVICNIYAPNHDDAAFFEDVIKTIENTKRYDAIILGGDFNLVMNPKIDRNESDSNHCKAHDVLSEYIDRIQICHAWRIQHPEERKYTWHRWSAHKPSCSRIDMLLIPLGLMDSVTKCNIENGIMSDHSVISIEIKTDNYVRGPGVWKFNNKMLADEIFCNKLITQIQVAEKNGQYLNPNDCWENLKMEVGMFCKDYAKQKAKRRRSRVDELHDLKNRLEQDALRNPTCKDIVNSMYKVNACINEMSIEETERSIFRSNCKYAKDGEKCTAYFMSLEKKRYMEKNMKGVFLNYGSVL